MEYNKKYLKYKNKYLQLKKQIGGIDITTNFCLDDGQINLNTLNIGDKIKFTFPQSSGITDFEFKIVQNPGDIEISKKITLQSVNLTSYEKPLLTISFDKENNYSKLNFIRAHKPFYTLDLLTSIYGCVTKYFKYPKMILEDDAMFIITDVFNYRALFYRVFINKDSIYYGGKLDFKPSKTTDDYFFRDEDYTNDKYLTDKSLLYNSDICDFVNYFVEAKKIINDDFLKTKRIRSNATEPFILEQIETIIKSLNNFGLDQKTRDYIQQLQNDSVDIENKKNIKVFMEKLMPHTPTNLEYKEAMKTLILSKPLYSAIPRIHKSHQYMMSTNVICSLCE